MPGQMRLGDRLLVDLLRDFGHLGDRVPFDEAQGHAADILDVARFLPPDHPEIGLYPQALQNHPGRKEAAPIQTLGEMEQ